ncbi:putative peroxidase-related enzyme [Azospirillum lipoferum]|uniref:Peroxidase-related enzyme n=1 Tax=Azospirillum lipoferum TaxID=193 RepID=A0A5A9GR93_AZOLI|nr:MULTISPECIES: peroxidase-related enzyme [Azospirillum]KAA0596134.1 peroxidase-related enzyme [Azospirillum lipoferum]MCP1611082.1 putative peroxidase-related enzyme [Azospirillum lipoferum]MDW5533793.1 peroxidase-related enzyme [Azospirillum sp. NL1]
MSATTIDAGGRIAQAVPDRIVPDLIDQLAGLSDASPLLVLRARRAEIRTRTQAAHDALLAPRRPGLFPASERAAVAERIATLAGDEALAAHYRGLAGGAGARPALIAHAERVTLSPRDSRPQHLRALEDAGLDAHGIVALSQLIALVNYQVRLLAGLHALKAGSAASRQGDPPSGPPVPADPAIGFTTDVLDWKPWLPPVVLENASEEQRVALAVTPSNTAIGAYSLVLAHEPEALLHRTPLFNGIMYAPRGLPRAERELVTAVESVLNGCVYCASVHARRFVELTGGREVVDALFVEGIAGLGDPRQQALSVAAARLTATPASLAAEDVAELRRAGLEEGEILDLILAVAIFSWANRLMLSLGEPVR